LVGYLPYNEILISENSSIRGFTNRIDPEELKWHFDEEDRIIELVEETDWLFQFDDDLPFRIEKIPIHIPKGKYHRVIPGEKDLIVKVTKIK
jgi:hypothetical protein